MTWEVTWDRGKTVYSNRPKINVSTTCFKKNWAEGWKVAWREDNEEFIVPIKFARAVDAQMAARNLTREIPAESYREMKAKIEAMGLEAFRKIMLEGLVWAVKN